MKDKVKDAFTTLKVLGRYMKIWLSDMQIINRDNNRKAEDGNINEDYFVAE